MFFFISFNCSVHYPMQIKIIRRLKDVFIFHSSIHISLFLSLLRPLPLSSRYLCPSPLFSLSRSYQPFARITFVSLLSLFLFPRCSTLFSPLLLPSSPRFLYLVLWWRVQHHRHYFNPLFPRFFLFLCPTDDAVSPRFLRFPPRCTTEHSPPFLPTRFCFKRL